MRHSLYNLGIYLYGFAMALAALFVRKARLWRQGRRNWLGDLDERMRLARTDGRRRVIWVHCASLGEFEQGRSLIDAWRTEISHPAGESVGSAIAQDFILLTFFSPSGYEQRKDYPMVDYVAYLPLDTPSNAAKFLDIVRPDVAIFVRYEFWYNFLRQLHLRSVPTYLVAAVMEERSRLFSGFLSPLYRQMFSWYRHIFVQDGESARLLQQHCALAATVAGDTRIDAIVKSRLRALPLPVFLPQLAKNKPVFVAASVYWSERHFLQPLLQRIVAEGWRVLLVPHEVDGAEIERWQGWLQQLNIRFDAYSRYGAEHNAFDEATLQQAADVWLIDAVGLLKRLYGLAKAAYVGGALAGGNLHNVVEPAAYEVPVFAGKSRRRFVEADDMLRRGLLHQLPLAQTPAQQQKAAEELLRALPTFIAQEHKAQFEAFFEQHTGATQKIIEVIAASVG